jgi:agmatinase
MQVLNEEKNFLAIEEKISSYENSKIVILPAPYEHTVSYGGGTGDAPEAILEASGYVEFYDNEFDSELCSDVGIATLHPIDFQDKADEDALYLIEEKVDKLLDDGKFAVTIGGEHTISAAPIASHIKKYPGMSILHFDAHSDLRDTYEDSKYSHACVMARVCEFLAPENLTQVGIRAQCIEESVFIKENKINTFYAWQVRRDANISNDWIQKVIDTLNDEVYISFDLDYFDPSIMPATGTPEPDGMLYSETIELLKAIVASGKKIIGLDVVELAPIEGLHHCDSLAASLIYKILNIAFSKEK